MTVAEWGPDGVDWDAGSSVGGCACLRLSRRLGEELGVDALWQWTLGAGS